MPFKKRGKFYYSPSGRRYTAKQVRLYYKTGGFQKSKLKKLKRLKKKKPKKKKKA